MSGFRPDLLTLVVFAPLLGAALVLYKRVFPARAGRPVPALLAGIRSFTVNKFYVDELYDAFIYRPIKWLAIGLFRVVDEFIIDTLAVRGTAWVTARIGSILRYLQTGDAQAYAAVMAVGLLVGVGYALFQVLAR